MPFATRKRKLRCWNTCTASLLLVVLNMSACTADKPAVVRLSPPGIQAGTTTKVTLVGKAGDGALQVWSDKTQLAFVVSEDQKSAEVTAPADALPGVHWLRFYNQSGSTDPLPFIVGQFPETSEEEPNDLPAEGQKVRASSTIVNGVLQKSGDTDAYKIALNEGQTLVAAVQAHRELGAPMDGILQVLDSSGTVLLHNDDDHGLDPFLAFKAPKSADYFIRIFALPAKPNSTVRLAGGDSYVYRLTLTTEAFVDHLLPPVVSKGKTVDVSVHGWNLPAELQHIALTAPESVGDQFMWSMADLAVARRLRLVSAPVVVESAKPTHRDQLPFVYCGRVEQPGQPDYVSFTGRKGQKITVSALCRAEYSQLDPVIRIVSPDGKLLKEADDRSKTDLDAEATVTLRQNGAHRVQIFDRFGNAGKRFFYAIHCREAIPSVELTTDQSTFELKPNEPLEITVNVIRNNGFAEALTVSAIGLPDGVSAEPATSESKGDTSKKITVKLKAADSAQHYTGVFRLVTGRSDGSKINATTQLGQTDQLTDQLWLSVVPSSEPVAEK